MEHEHDLKFGPGARFGLLMGVGVFVLGGLAYKNDWFAGPPPYSCDSDNNGGLLRDNGHIYMPYPSVVKPNRLVTEGTVLLELTGNQSATIEFVRPINCGESRVRYLGAKLAGSGREYAYSDAIEEGFPPRASRGFGSLESAIGAEILPYHTNRGGDEMPGAELLIGYQFPQHLTADLPDVVMARAGVEVGYTVDGEHHDDFLPNRVVICNPVTMTAHACSARMFELFPGG